MNESVPPPKKDEEDDAEGEGDGKGSRMKLREDEGIREKDAAIVEVVDCVELTRSTPSVR